VFAAEDDKGNWLRLCGFDVPECCPITCVQLDIHCCGCCGPNGSSEALIVELWGKDHSLLATGKLRGPWCDCCACRPDIIAEFDNAVEPCDIEAVTIRLANGEDNISIDWLRISFGADCGCCKFKWHKAYKGDLCCVDFGKDGYDGIWIN
jgi:hypothetical protein